MASFSNRPGDDRMRAIVAYSAIAPHGSFNYTGEGITVTIPRGEFCNVLAWARDHDLRESQGHYFPLGSDNPHESMRHDGNYPDSRGFWLYWHFVPR